MALDRMHNSRHPLDRLTLTLTITLTFDRFIDRQGIVMDYQPFLFYRTDRQNHRIIDDRLT